jgi:hypothetical protein
MVQRTKRSSRSGELFIEASGQTRLIDKSIEQKVLEQRVECLGMTFENDAARRAYFLERLREKLNDPEFRAIEGFPVGEDEQILSLSDPPYYTACPNPFLADFVAHYGKPYDPKSPYHRTPYAIDVSEGKTDPLYTAHGYHTKVPPKAIIRAILHYTDPGDIVLDGFAGSGMTAVAAQLCAAPTKELKQKIDEERKEAKLKPAVWGLRRAILSELAPAATLIAANYNLPFDVSEFSRAAQQILDEVEAEYGWMYETLHKDGKTKGRINFTVWSEVFSCPDCSNEIVFVEEALNPETKRVRDEFPCPHCGATLTKERLDKAYESRLDPGIGEVVKSPKRQPVIINYNIADQRFQKKPDRGDLDLLERIARLPFPSELPTLPIPYMHMTHERAHMDQQGITHVHQFFLPRAGQTLSALWRKANAHADPRIRHMLQFFVDQAIWGLSLLNRYGPTHFSQVNRQLSGVYYVASQIFECSPWYNLDGKLHRLVKAFSEYRSRAQVGCCATTSSTVSLGLPENCVDYVFTDPPFGENIYYADLNFLVESWYRLTTESKPEAIIDRAKHKDLVAYQGLMRHCLVEFYRVLKPGRWLTMVFHNSSNVVWNAIQEALLSAGFIVADVRTLDKQQGSYRQVTSTAVKKDLVISAYKPNEGLEQSFKLNAGNTDGVWDFVRQHLRQLPVFVEGSKKSQPVGERQEFALFDRMVAFHVQRGIAVPMGATEFLSGLKARFPERDGMYFLPEQIAEYDRRRLEVDGVEQLSLFMNDERAAIQWIRLELAKSPETYQQIYPKFLRELHKANYEQLPELRDILQQNFLKDGDDRWYVPDPKKQQDLEKLREQALLREFEEYKNTGPKRIKVFRTEAVRAGFKAAWAARDYKTIVAVAEKLPEEVVHEDQTILMYYDNASMRMG